MTQPRIRYWFRRRDEGFIAGQRVQRLALHGATPLARWHEGEAKDARRDRKAEAEAHLG